MYSRVHHGGEYLPVAEVVNDWAIIVKKFNRSLHDTHWPHRKGGKNRSGGQGMQHNFMLTCILHNTFNCYMDMKNIPTEDLNFETYCLQLADLLFEYAFQMPN